MRKWERKCTRRKRVWTSKLVPVSIISSDPSQDRLIAETEARNRYKAGELSWDVTRRMYCLILEDYNPEKDTAPRIPDFLLNALRLEI